MPSKNGTKQRIAAVGATVLMVAGLFLVFAGTSAAAPVSAAASGSVSAGPAWAYGGTNTTSGTESIGPVNVSWTVTVGADVIFTATPTVANTTELHAQRTVGVSIALTVTGPKGTLTYNYKAVEADSAFANVTNASRVDVSGSMVPALGIDNASFHANASLTEAAVAKGTHASAGAYLNATAVAEAKVGFVPSLGVVPLNLTGVSSWNSTAEASPSAAWNVSFNYHLRGWNGTNASGAVTHNGSWKASGPVDLYGQVYAGELPRFHDHGDRLGIVIVVTGPADLYDGFIVVPHGFDPFGGAAQPYADHSMSDVAVSGETQFVTRGHLGVRSFSAGEMRFGGASGAVPLVAPATAQPIGNGVGGAVVEQPESVSTAQSQSHCLQFGCSGAAPWFSGLLAAAVIGGLIAAVAGAVGVVEWRSYARRKHRATQLVGGYGETLANGVPPAVANPPVPAPSAPSGPSIESGPGRQL
jgi:hypothetical protein